MTATPHCQRCRRPAPDSDSYEFLTWEADDAEGKTMICPGCLTLGEENAIAADDERTARDASDA